MKRIILEGIGIILIPVTIYTLLWLLTFCKFKYVLYITEPIIIMLNFLALMIGLGYIIGSYIDEYRQN